MLVEPYRLVPPVGALHALLAAPRRAAAAVRHTEAAARSDCGALARAGHLVAAEVDRAVAALAASAPLCALDEVAGTTARPERVRVAQSLARRRGHVEPPADPQAFGLLGVVGVPVTHLVAEAWALLASPLGLSDLARRCTWGVGRTTLGLGCGVLAGLALVAKVGPTALAVAVGVAVGCARLVVGRARSTQAASIRPEIAQVAAFDAQRRLERHLAGRPPEEHTDDVDAATRALERAWAADRWVRTWRQADGVRTLGTEAELAAALARMCAHPDGPPADHAAEKGAGETSPGRRSARWAEQVADVLRPASLVHSLAGVVLQVGAGVGRGRAATGLREVDATELMQSPAELSTCLVAHAGDRDDRRRRQAVRVDTALFWPAGAVVAMANGVPVVLPQAVHVVWTLDVEAPASADAQPALVRVHRLTLAVGQAAAQTIRRVEVG